jgi:hypothetical protein
VWSVSEDQGGGREGHPDPADFHEIGVEDVVFAGKVVWGGRCLGGRGAGWWSVGGWREDGEDGAQGEGCWVD